MNPPNPKCIVCAEKPEVKVTLNLQKMTVKALEEKILKGELNMVAPGTHDKKFKMRHLEKYQCQCAFADVEIEDGKGTIIISSDPEELQELADKSLSEFAKDGAVLTCDDYNQKYCLRMILFHA